MPTIGFNVETIKVNNLTFQVRPRPRCAAPRAPPR
jgi:hypothetical protein